MKIFIIQLIFYIAILKT